MRKVGHTSHVDTDLIGTAVLFGEQRIRLFSCEKSAK
jgi:hypothetical protein